MTTAYHTPRGDGPVPIADALDEFFARRGWSRREILSPDRAAAADLPDDLRYALLAEARRHCLDGQPVEIIGAEIRLLADRAGFPLADSEAAVRHWLGYPAEREGQP